VRQTELVAFTDWIKASARDSKLRDAPKLAVSEPEHPNEVNNNRFFSSGAALIARSGSTKGKLHYRLHLLSRKFGNQMHCCDSHI
jgi:hypothetical protein